MASQQGARLCGDRLGGLHVKRAGLTAAGVRCRGVYASTDELEADIELVNKIVTHLIRHGVLQEAFKPVQLPDETALAYKRRCHKERELCISPNLVAE